jgi:predicted ATPase/DNA-binding CsgD family transcriptional regulator
MLTASQAERNLDFEVAMNATTVQARGNLPSNLTNFVGRRSELAKVKQLLSRTRMVTLTGVGGVGKTRLAMQTATDLQRAFPDGVWLVELSSLSDPAFLSQTVVAALGIPDQGGRPGLDVLIDYLGDKKLLLLLDSCEHLVDACAYLADTLLAACPRLHILATSRQAIAIAGEHTLLVPSLSIPETRQGALPASAAAGSDAVQLFVARAEAVQPDFALTDDNAEIVAHLCRRLEGIPLAIELAAGRLRHLPLKQIDERLGDRYHFLTGGSRVALPRQQTLRALIDWSFDLCSPAEQTLWARLSVFSGSFELDAAEHVCSGEPIPREDVLDLLSGLVDKSVLGRDERAPRATRYRLLETIRQYGQERRTESDGDLALRRRHRDWYLGLVERAEAAWFGPDQIDWFNRLQLDHANIRAALNFCLSSPAESEQGLRIAAALRAYWHSTGFMNEGRHWLDQALRLETAPTAARAKALWVESWLASLQNDADTATSRVAESRALAQQLGDGTLIAQATLAAGVVAMHNEDQRSAAALFEEAIERHQGTTNLSGLAIALYLLSLTSTILGDTEKAITVGEQCRALCATHDEHWYQSHALWVLGIAVWLQGDTRRATHLEQNSLRLKPSHHDRLGIAHCIEALGWFAASDQQWQRSAQLLGAAQAVREEIGVALHGFAHLVTYHDQAEARVRRGLGDPAFDKAFHDGLDFTLDDAVAYGLNEKAKPAARTKQDDSATPLTRREAEVAELVAQGMSNKAIAAKLVVAQRTAEAHVENILVKLGFTTRAQIAAWLAERRAQQTLGSPGYPGA